MQDDKLSEFAVPLLTDMYQITMAYAYWKSDRHENAAVFDLFFRKHPFKGEFTVFAGLTDCLKHVARFKFEENQIAHLKKKLPHCDPLFFEWLAQVDMSKVKLYAIPEGTIVHPREPLIRVEGPLALCQLLETTFLNLVNYATLMATNAARFRLVAGPDSNLFEFGLRRAQGPDGAMSASRYSYVGGFNGTSNVLASMIYDITCRGTHAHSFVTSYTGMEDLGSTKIQLKDRSEEFLPLVMQYRKELDFEQTNDGELAAFIAYAQAFPDGFLALVDTYDTLRSGVPNMLCVALALHKLGCKPIGVRLDSGDLAYLSKETRLMYKRVDEQYNLGGDFSNMVIMASNDINEDTLVSLRFQQSEIDTFGIGTHLVTCQAQPALGGVFKLVEIDGHPRIKLSNAIEKITIPGRKVAYRLHAKPDYPVVDVLTTVDEQPPKVGERLLCRHPFDEAKRAYITPTKVKLLHELVFDGKIVGALPSVEEVRSRVMDELKSCREDQLRQLNPTPYKVSATESLYQFIHDAWMKEAPIPEISE